MGARQNIQSLGDGGGISKLSPEISQTLLDAGLSVGDQNRWFWRRTGENGQELGVDFQKNVGVMALFCGDWTAEQIYQRFNDQLMKAFGYNWKIVGVRGRREPGQPDNPTWGPAAKPLPRSEAEEIAFQRASLARFDEWVEANREYIQNMEMITATRAFVTAGLDRAEAKLAAGNQNSVDTNQVRRYDMDF